MSIRMTAPRAQNDPAGAPPFLWLPFDNREYPSVADSSNLHVITNDTEYSVAPSVGVAGTGSWGGAGGMFFNGRASDGSYDATATMPTYVVPDNGSNPLAEYSRGLLRLDNMDIGGDTLLMLQSFYTTPDDNAEVGFVVDMRWKNSANANSGALNFQHKAGTTTKSLPRIGFAGGSDALTLVSPFPLVDMSGFCTLGWLVRRTGASQLTLSRATNETVSWDSTASPASLPGTSEFSSATPGGIGFLGHGLNTTTNRLNKSVAGASLRVGLRNVFIARCSNDAIAAFANIYNAFRARKGAVPFDLLRGM